MKIKKVKEIFGWTVSLVNLVVENELFQMQEVGVVEIVSVVWH